MSQQAVIGLDLGSSNLVCAVRVPGEPPSLVHNEASEISTVPAVSLRARSSPAAAVGFSGRSVGSSAAQLVATRPLETVGSVLESCWQTPEGSVLEVPGSGTKLEADQLLAMAAGAVIRAGLEKLGLAGEMDQGGFPAGVTVVAAIPPWATPASARCVHRALGIAGVPASQRRVVPSTSSLFATHLAKHGRGPAERKGVVVVDVGHAGYSAALAVNPAGGAGGDGDGKGAGGDGDDGDDGEKKETGAGGDNGANSYNVIAVRAASGAGGSALDDKLVEHIAGVIREKHGVDVMGNAKLVARVRRASERCKKTLSTIPQARVDVENVGNDKDASLTVERSTLEAMVAPLCETIRAGTAECVAAIGGGDGEDNDGIIIEVVGGGARVPAVQAAIREAAPGAELRFTIDSTAGVAIGSTYLASATGGDYGDAGASDTALAKVTLAPNASETIATWPGHEESASMDVSAGRALELQLRALDREERLLHEARNALESVILQTRSARGGKHGSLIPDAAIAAVDAAEEWLYDHDESTATAEVYNTRRTDLDAEVRKIAAAYYDAVESERAKMEEELRKEAEEAEQNAEEKDDHDTRKLKFPDRMRLVMINKDEGTELFKHGNHAHAAGRYVKALTHADKFVGDLTDEQKAEVRKVRLSLHLNAAQCFLKLNMLPKAIGNLNEAIAIDPTSVKAFYRRAVAFEAQKKIDEAEADIKAALKLAPEDAAVVQLAERIRAIRKKQKDAQAKMAAKMFGK